MGYISAHFPNWAPLITTWKHLSSLRNGDGEWEGMGRKKHTTPAPRVGLRKLMFVRQMLNGLTYPRPESIWPIFSCAWGRRTIVLQNANLRIFIFWKKTAQKQRSFQIVLQNALNSSMPLLWSLISGTDIFLGYFFNTRLERLSLYLKGVYC